MLSYSMFDCSIKCSLFIGGNKDYKYLRDVLYSVIKLLSEEMTRPIMHSNDSTVRWCVTVNIDIAITY